MSTRTATVIVPGPLSTVQDLGRPGLGHLGVGRSGAADRPSLVMANRVVGNDAHAAGIEITLGRLRLRLDADADIAFTGAPCEFTVDQVAGAMNTVVPVRAGQELRCRAPSSGLRTYLAIDGGVTVAPVLGSRSTDTLAALGPAVLAAGMVLPLGDPHTGGRRGTPPRPGIGTDTDTAVPADQQGRFVDPEDRPLTVVAGPRDDWFTSEAVTALYSEPWSVTAEANRVGVRLSGPRLGRRITGELPPEPMVAGAIQVPPNGQPIIFLADHPVTGGYPVIGVIADSDLHLAAQLRPGRSVRFQPRHQAGSVTLARGNPVVR